MRKLKESTRLKLKYIATQPKIESDKVYAIQGTWLQIMMDIARREDTPMRIVEDMITIVDHTLEKEELYGPIGG